MTRIALGTLALLAALAVTTTGVTLAAKPHKRSFYKGLTSQDTTAFLRTSKNGERVSGFDFGKVDIQCDTDPPGETSERRLDYSGSIRVGRRGGFRGTLPNEHTNEGAMTIVGKFVTRDRATGTVKYLDRGCIGLNTLTWSSRRLR